MPATLIALLPFVSLAMTGIGAWAVWRAAGRAAWRDRARRARAGASAAARGLDAARREQARHAHAKTDPRGAD